MASVSWDYPRDRMLALQRQTQAVSIAAPIDTGLSLAVEIGQCIRFIGSLGLPHREVREHESNSLT